MDAPSRAPNQGRFGTFGGVFTPSILTILGVIMYLRVGWVVGKVGLAGALILVAISHLITLATGLSVSSIATNRTVGAGGAYFIISRSLGAPTGAATGIPLFFGQALSVTFYIVGFTESLQLLWPNLPTRLLSSAVLLVLTAITLKGADAAIKVQYVVMAAIGLSLVSFFSGWVPDHSLSEAVDRIPWWAGDKAPYAEVFAVFFPAVTGIMAGVGMSGDLKDPRRALPRGTLLAIVVGFVVYSIFPLWLALNADLHTLVHNKNVVWTISRVPALIYVGVWGATLSSAVGSMLTAPRTLQALAVDGLAPRIFARGYGPDNEPRAGIVLSFVLAQTGIIVGDLDVIAPVLTMFFLATYGITNLACGLERWAASPSFRPDFSVPAPISLVGGAACLYAMSIINTPAMLVATLFCGMIYLVAQRRALGTTYGDARHGIWAAMVRSALLRLRGIEFHPLNWRPNLVIIGEESESRDWLVQLGSVIVQDRGIVTYFQLLVGPIEALATRRRELAKTLEGRIHKRYPNVFTRVDVVESAARGAVTVAQSYGIGSFEANTVMLAWPDDAASLEDPERFVHMLRDLVSLDRSLLIAKHHPQRGFGRRRSIHIWWGGLQANGGLMLLIAYLVAAHDHWRGATVHVNTVVDDETKRATTEAAIRGVLAGARLHAEPKVLLREGRPIEEIMAETSAAADLTIAGLRLPRQTDPPEAFIARVNTILGALPTTVLVHSSRNFESEPVLFDDVTRPAEAAAAPPTRDQAPTRLMPQEERESERGQDDLDLLDDDDGLDDDDDTPVHQPAPEPMREHLLTPIPSSPGMDPEGVEGEDEPTMPDMGGAGSGE